VWGSAPGAATVMVLMAEAFGGDMRLVAFMQFLRVMLVALVASIVARLWVTPGGSVAHTIDWFPSLAAVPLIETLALAVGGAFLGVKLRIPAGPLLVPLAASKVDLPFVMAMQTARFLLVLLVGPSLARLVARWTPA
jgi:uncharacterized protein